MRDTRSGPLVDHSRLEAAILRLLLIEHPDRLTVAELEREVGVDLRSENGAVPEAIDRLERAGLLHLQGELAVPSRAARYFDGLRIY